MVRDSGDRSDTVAARQSVHDAHRARSLAPQRATMTPLAALLALAVLTPLISGEHQVGVCKLDYCKCTPDTHPSWKIVNCTLQHDQVRLTRMFQTNKSERALPDVRSDALSYSDINLFLGIQSVRKVFRLDTYSYLFI